MITFLALLFASISFILFCLVHCSTPYDCTVNDDEQEHALAKMNGKYH